MSDLVEFLRARLDEEAAEAAMAADFHAGGVRLATTYETEGIITISAGVRLEVRTGRAAAEVEAKRRLLAFLLDLENKALDEDWWNLDTEEPFQLLALPYADHPDYDESWRP